MAKHNYLNLSLRSVFHMFVSGSLFYFLQSHFHISLGFGVLGAFFTGLTNEIWEDIRKIEATFHTTEVFKRDRLLASLSVIGTGIILKTNFVLAALAAPISLIFLTCQMDRKNGIKIGERQLIKPIFDVASITLGPLVFILLLKFVR
ncbi:MAG TPA: hypothetical protein VG917_02220 [Patescibacteria group bacterium]|nr:hypothetical protein [Patescibacteria group bacterium]